MNGWYNPDNWLDVLDHLLLVLGAVAVIAVPSFLAARTHKSIKTETKVIREQLVNGHSSPMRQDLDRAIAAIENLAKDVQGLRLDLSYEEGQRRDLRAEVNEKIADLTKRLGA